MCVIESARRVHCFVPLPELSAGVVGPRNLISSDAGRIKRFAEETSCYSWEYDSEEYAQDGGECGDLLKRFAVSTQHLERMNKGMVGKEDLL